MRVSSAPADGNLSMYFVYPQSWTFVLEHEMNVRTMNRRKLEMNVCVTVQLLSVITYA
jgi:hypothetical protein